MTTLSNTASVRRGDHKGGANGEQIAWIVLVTGMSGSGKTTAVQALEDEGFYCIDNLPPTLAPAAVAACLTGAEPRRRIALVLDARSGELLEQAPQAIAELETQGHNVEILFLDASDDVLIRRYSETRRRHPLETAVPSTVAESIARERRALAPLRDLSTRIVDTSRLKAAALKRTISDGTRDHDRSLLLTIVSFGFKHALPAEANLVFDVRHLSNPYFVPELKELPGTDPLVRDFVLAQPEALELLTRLDDLLRYLSPLYLREGKRYLTVAVGCTGGRHRSVVLAEALAQKISAYAPALGMVTTVRHRDVALA